MKTELCARQQSHRRVGVRFTHNEYRQILNTFSGRFQFFNEPIGGEFVILRHDVEFCMERAFQLAQIEYECTVGSTFLIQVMSEAYNPFSVTNKELLLEIQNMGHQVGLHLYVSHLKNSDFDGLNEEIMRQKHIFENGLSIECEVFSFHRPPRWVLEIRENYLGGLINAYGPKFFEFSDNPTSIKYLADSKHQWTYGYPLEYKDEKKLQLLIHPDEWTNGGDDGDLKFFEGIIASKRRLIVETLERETVHFTKYKDFFE